MAKYTFLGSNDRLDLYMGDYNEPEQQDPVTKAISVVITFLCYLIVLLTFPVSAFCCVKVIRDYEKAVVFRLGRLQPLKEPGTILILPCIDKWFRVDMRVRAFNIPPQKIVTKDQAAVLVGADVQYMIKDPIASKGVIQDLNHSLRILAQTTLVNTMMTMKLIEVQNDRRFVAIRAEDKLNKATRQWGVRIRGISISEPQVICDVPEAKPLDIASLFSSSGSDNPLNTIFQVLQGNTGMTPQMLQIPHNAPQQPAVPLDQVAASRPDLSQIIALFNHVTDEYLVQHVGCVYQFNINGGTETWHLDLKHGRGLGGAGPPTTCAPDVIISLSSEDLQGLFSGQITPFDAYMQGKVVIVGDVREAMKLRDVVDRMKQRRMPAKNTHARDDIMIV